MLVKTARTNCIDEKQLLINYIGLHVWREENHNKHYGVRLDLVTVKFKELKNCLHVFYTGYTNVSGQQSTTKSITA